MPNTYNRRGSESDDIAEPDNFAAPDHFAEPDLSTRILEPDGISDFQVNHASTSNSDGPADKQRSNSKFNDNFTSETLPWAGPPSQDSFGLFQLWPDPDVEEERQTKTDADVVAIHGLGGHPMRTWETGDRLWLRDFLPKDLRTARIFTFGYDSGTAFTDSKSRISDFATQLLEKLVQLQRRTKDTKRKTIFVCHSLGGIILKQALIIANERGRYSAVGKSATAALFLGTPHRGSDVTFWSKTIDLIANFKFFDVNRTDFLKNLKPKSIELGDICSMFVERAVALQIFTIYERVKMKELPDLVVDESAAILHLPNETPIPMEADHRGLVRYLTSSDQNYIVVRDCLTELFDTIMDEDGETVSGLTPQQLRYARRLTSLCEESLLEQNLQEWSRNSDWLLQHDEFKSWRDLRGRRRALWIHGPPGSGKTVLMKQIVPFLKAESHSEEAKVPVRKIIHFFFDDKHPRSRTNRSLIASVLLQLLLDPRTSSVVRYIDKDVFEGFYTDVDTLWACFAGIVHRSRGILFFLVIDALDEMEREHGETRQHFIDQLLHISANDLSGHLRILITDRQRRPYRFQKVISSEELNVDNEATRKNIENFIRTKLRGRIDVSAEGAGYFVQELVKIAQGNFLRAALTWRQFDRKVRYWSTDAMNRELSALHELPPGLDGFYVEILNSIPRAVWWEARRIFATIMVAIEPLSLRQLAHLATLQDADDGRPKRVFVSPEDYLEFFQKYCAHMVKLSDTGVVSFAHQTVKELLSSQPDQSERGMILSQFQIPSPDAHSFMLNQCLQVLELEISYDHNWPMELIDLKREIRDSQESESTVTARLDAIGGTPCLRYAIYHWATHYQGVTTDSQLDEKLASFLVRRSSFYYCKVWEFSQTFDSAIIRNMVDITSKDPIAPLLHIITRGEFPALVWILLKQQNVSVLRAAKAELSPLGWSIACRRKQAFLVILNSGLVNLNMVQDQRMRPIHQAVLCDDIFFLRALIANDSVDINSVEGSGDTPLHRAIGQHKYESAQMLLELPTIDLFLTDSSGRTPYEATFSDLQAETLSMKILQVMNARGYSSLPTKHLNPLRAAGSLGWRRMMESVVENNIELAISVDDSGLCPLTWHAYYGEKTQLQWLLGRIPSKLMSATTNFGKSNLVSLCAHRGWQDTTKILINQYGLRAPEADHQGRNLLHWAIFHGWDLSEEEVANYTSIQLNQQDRDGSTPLHLAILSRDISIISILCSRGASPVIKDQQGFTPAHLAAESGYRAALQYFIDSPHREFGRTREGASLLHCITLWFDSKIVDRFIVAKKPLLDCRDRKGRTPLHYAAASGNASAIEALLKKGANIDQRDQDGRTALHDALRSGGYESALVLLKHNADATRLDNYLQSCLQLCARYGQEPLGRLFMENGARINAGDMFGMTALHRACASGSLALIDLLLNGNADWTRLDKFSDSPLDKAVIRGQPAAVKQFLEYLALNNVDRGRKRDLIDNALDRALGEEHIYIEDLLVSAGAAPTGLAIKKWRPYVPEEKGSSKWPLTTRSPFGPQEDPFKPFRDQPTEPITMVRPLSNTEYYPKRQEKHTVPVYSYSEQEPDKIPNSYGAQNPYMAQSTYGTANHYTPPFTAPNYVSSGPYVSKDPNSPQYFHRSPGSHIPPYSYGQHDPYAQQNPFARSDPYASQDPYARQRTYLHPYSTAEAEPLYRQEQDRPSQDSSVRSTRRTSRREDRSPSPGPRSSRQDDDFEEPTKKRKKKKTRRPLF